MPDKLTSKEQAVVKSLMDADKSLTASEIITQDPELNINTVQSVLRSLLRRGYIDVAEIVYSGTVLCRSYRPTEKSADLAYQELSSNFRRLCKSTSGPKLLTNLIGDIDADEDKDAMFAELEAIIAERKASSSQEKRKEDK